MLGIARVPILDILNIITSVRIEFSCSACHRRIRPLPCNGLPQNIFRKCLSGTRSGYGVDFRQGSEVPTIRAVNDMMPEVSSPSASMQ